MNQATEKNQCTENIFLHDVELHEMQVLRDEGIYRHIKFKNPKSNNCQFDLITWPGHICCSGDMGTYVFSRLDDMFVFFRDQFNPEYWGEKLQSISSVNGYKKYSRDKFESVVRRYVEEHIEDYGLTSLQADSLRESADIDVIRKGEFELSAREAVRDFERENFEFHDFWEEDLGEFTEHYIWCCRAITWGVSQYDEHNKPSPARTSFK